MCAASVRRRLLSRYLDSDSSRPSWIFGGLLFVCRSNLPDIDIYGDIRVIAMMGTRNNETPPRGKLRGINPKRLTSL